MIWHSENSSFNKSCMEESTILSITAKRFCQRTQGSTRWAEVRVLFLQRGGSLPVPPSPKPKLYTCAGLQIYHRSWCTPKVASISANFWSIAGHTVEVSASLGPQQAGHTPYQSLLSVRPIDVRVQSIRPTVCAFGIKSPMSLVLFVHPECTRPLKKRFCGCNRCPSFVKGHFRSRPALP